MRENIKNIGSRFDVQDRLDWIVKFENIPRISKKLLLKVRFLMLLGFWIIIKLEYKAKIIIKYMIGINNVFLLKFNLLL